MHPFARRSTTSLDADIPPAWPAIKSLEETNSFALRACMSGDIAHALALGAVVFGSLAHSITSRARFADDPFSFNHEARAGETSPFQYRNPLFAQFS